MAHECLLQKSKLMWLVFNLAQGHPNTHGQDSAWTKVLKKVYYDVRRGVHGQ